MSLPPLEAVNSLSLEVMGRPAMPTIWLATSFCVSLLIVGAWLSNQQLLQDEVKVF